MGEFSYKGTISKIYIRDNSHRSRDKMANSVVNVLYVISALSVVGIATALIPNVPRQLSELSGTCPKDSVGNYPNCKCSEGKIYDPDNSICLDLDRTKCPKRSSGQPPHCNCEEGYQLDDIHWYCRPWYLNVTHQFENSCEPYHNWNGTHCIKIPCPSYSLTPQLFLPNCSYAAPVGPVVDIYNDDPVTVRNEIYGSYCPAYHYWNKKTEKCERIKCPEGHLGDFQPNCIFKPKCPTEFPGEWPYCNIYDAGARLDERPANTVLNHHPQHF